MVADEAEFFLLGEYGGFVVDGAVAEVKEQMRRDVIALDGLDGIAGGDGLALLVADDEKAVDGALGIADVDSFCAQERKWQEGDEEEGEAEIRGWDNAPMQIMLVLSI
jgi:hypothetical protein